MKKQHKKLRASQFRYLTKEEIKNPFLYLSEMYGTGASRDYRLREIELLVTAGAAPTMSPTMIRDAGYSAKQLIKPIEMAYVIFKRCQLPLLDKPLTLFACNKDLRSYIRKGKYTTNGEQNPAHEISRIFSYKSLTSWYACLDRLWTNRVDTDGPDEKDIPADNFLVIEELLLRLAYALQCIYKEDKLPHKRKHLAKKEIDTKKPDSIPNDNPSGRLPTYSGFHPKREVEVPAWLAPQPYPVEAIKSFCSIDSLSSWHETLWFWYQSVITSDLYWSAHHEKPAYSGSDLLFNYACICSLLEMHRSQATETPALSRPPEGTDPPSILRNKACSSIRYNGQIEVLYYVSDHDKASPMDSIHSALHAYSKEQWGEILYEWLFFGLSSRAIDEGDFIADAARIYQLLVRIVELTYVLACQEEELKPVSTGADA